jgi:hypothetical protein
MIGAFAADQKWVVEQVANLGHLIGNHTYSHPALDSQSGTYAANEIIKTDGVISDVPRALKLFRPPYGSWSLQVAGQLNWTPAWPYVGPIMWDIDAGDWLFWRNGRSAKECAAAYVESIQRVGRGIILMHDSSFEADIRSNSYGFQAAQRIVDWLQNNDYTFVQLDSIPQVVSAARISSVVALQTATSQYISPQQGGGGRVLADGPAVGAWEPLGVVELDDNKIALRCLSGHYFSPQNGGEGGILANALAIGDWEVLTREDLENGNIAIRCPSGHYISPQGGGGGEVFANCPAISAWETLRVARPG